MAIKCGNCMEYHGTVDEIRVCSKLIHPADPERAAAQNDSAAVMDKLSGTTTTINRPSDKQVSYAMQLLDTRVWPDKFTEADLKGMERRQVSDLISGLVKAKRKDLGAPGPNTKPKEDWSAIPEGRYALEFNDGWKFFQVKHGHTRTFLNLLIGSPGDYRKQAMYGVPAQRTFEMIMKITPKQASINYGLKAQVCGVCSSPLTNKESLDYGIGPICRGKMGW